MAEDPNDILRAAMQAGGVKRRQSGPQAGGEWFAGSRVREATDPTAMEQQAIDELRGEAAQRVESFAHDPAVVESVVQNAMEIIESLPASFAKDIREATDVVKKAAEAMNGVDGAEKQRLVNEVLAALTNGRPLSDLVGKNILAQQLIADNAVLDTQNQGFIADQAAQVEVRGPNPNTGKIKGAVVLAIALGTYALEIGATKTAAMQLLDIYDIPIIKPGVDMLAAALKGRGVADAASWAKFIFGGTFAASVGGVLLATKGIGWKNLKPKGKIALVASLGTSLGLGYLALQNYVTDLSDVAAIGTKVSSGFKEPAKLAADAKTDRTALYAQLDKDITGAVDAEVNRPGSEGYAYWSAFIDAGLNGTFDQARLDEYLTKNPGARAKVEAEHKRLQAGLAALKKQYFGEDPSKGLKQLSQPTVDLDTAPALTMKIVRVGDAAAESTLWSGMGHVLSPFSDTQTSVGLYKEAVIAAEAFDTLISNDVGAIRATRDRVTKYLDGMIALAKGNAAMVKSLTTLKTTLLTKLQPLKLSPGAGVAALKGIEQPTGKWVIIPNDAVWQRMQASIKDAFIFKQLGWDVSPGNPNQVFWATGIVALLGGFFLLINGGSYFASRAINKRREGEFELAVQEGVEGLNEREANLANGVASAFEASMMQFVLNSGATTLNYPIPGSLIQLHVRRHLRESYLKETQGKLSATERVGWFLHGLGLGKTPDDARIFIDYDTWLEAKLKAFDTNPAREMEKVMHDLYPEYDQLIEANANALSADGAQKGPAQQMLGRQLQQARAAQLKRFATLITERLAVIDLVPQSGASAEEVKNGAVRINPDDENIIVSRTLALAAFAARNTIGEREQLERTLYNLRQMGIVPDKTVSDGEDLTIGMFPLGPKFAVEDQLMRIRAAREVGMVTPEGEAGDFERFDKYMSEVAKALKGIRDTVISKDPDLKDYYIDFVWRKTEGGYYTIDIDLYPDKNLLGTPAARLTYTKAIPDFDPKKTPQESIRGLVDWLKPGSHAIQGLIAQARHTFFQKEHAKLLADIRRERGSGPQPPEVVLVDGGKKTAISDDLRKKLIESYYLSELLEEQKDSIPLARRGIAIEQGKFRAFLNPKEYRSDKRSGIDLERYLSDVGSRDYDPDVKITYNAGNTTFYISKERRVLLGTRREIGKPVPLRAKDYRIETLERAIETATVE